MNPVQIRNAAAVIVVVALVGTVAWFKSEGTSRSQDGSTPAVVDASGTGTASSALTTKGLPRLVDLGAGKCKACKEMAPILKAVRKEFTGRAVVEFIDVWENPDASHEYDVRIIPTQIFYDRDGKEVWRHVGTLSKAEIAERLRSLGA